MKPVEIEFLMKGNLWRGLDDARRKAESLDSVLRNVGAAVGIAFGTRQAMEFARKVMDVRGEVESLQISFETLAGKAKGRKLFGDIREWVVNTPMMMQPVAKGAQTLLGFNIEAEKVMPILRQIGDISMGDAQKFNSLTLAFAQMSSTGKLMGQDLLQMINAGFNPLVVISEKTGKSMATLKKEMADGRITVKMVEDAFASATAEGGRFHGMLEKQSKGIEGAMSNLQGAWDDMLNDIGEKSQGVMVNAINQATELVKDYDKVLDVLEEIVVAYGSYKAALMLVVAAQKAMALAENIRLVMMFRKEMGLLTAAQQAFNRAALVNPYVLIGVAAAGAGVAIYKMAAADDAAEAAQKKLNQTMEDANQLAKDHQRELDELTRKATSEAASTDDRRTAMQQLVDKYPSIIQKYIDEKGHLTDIINLKREIARLDGQEKAGQLEEQTRKAKRYLELYDKSRKGIQLSDGERKLLNNLADEVWDQQSWWTQTKSGSRGNFVADYYQGMLPSLERSSARTKTENMLREYNNGLEKMTDDELVKMSKDAQDALRKIGDKNSAFLDSYTHDYVTRGDLGERLGIIGNILEQRHPKKGSGDGSSGSGKTAKLLKEQREQAAKAIEEERRWEEEISRMKRDASDASRDAEIAAIKDDGERERAEQEEQHKRNLRQIQEQANEMKKAIYEHNKTVWENSHKDSPYELTEAGKAGWSAIQLPQDQQSIIDAREKKENEEHNRRLRERLKSDEKAQKEILYRYIQAFGSYEDQRNAIEKKANDEVYALEQQLQYAKTDLEKASINAQIELVKDGAKRETEELDKKFGKTAHALGDLFADATKKSVKSLDKLIKKYRAFLKYREGKMSKEDLKSLYGFTDNEIDDINDKLKTGATTTKELADRIHQLEDSFGNKSSWKAFKLQLQAINQQLQDAKKNGEDVDEWYYHSQSLTLLGEKFNEVASYAESFGNILTSCFHVDSSEVSNAIEGLKKIGGLIQNVAQGASTGGVYGALAGFAISVVDILSKQAAEAEQAEQRDQQKRLERISNSIDALKNSIDKLNENIGYGIQALQKTEEIEGLIAQEQEHYLTGLLESNGISTASLTMKSWSEQDLEMAKAARKIADMYGIDADYENSFLNESYGKWSALLSNVSASDLAKILYEIRDTDPELWGVLTSAEDAKEYFEGLADTYNEIAEAKKKLNEQLTTTTEENVFNDFLNSLYGLADGSEDVFEDIADNWQEMVNKMAINNIIGELFRDKLKHWYMALAKANEERGKVSEDATEEEIAEANRAYLDALDRLKEEYEGYVTEAQSSIEQLRELGIISATGENAGQSQTAKTGGFSAMSQDQGTKLDGMFTAGLQHWSSMDKELTNVSDRLGTALDRLKRIEENTEYCRKLDIIAEDISHIKSNGVKIR